MESRAQFRWLDEVILLAQYEKKALMKCKISLTQARIKITTIRQASILSVMIIFNLMGKFSRQSISLPTKFENLKVGSDETQLFFWPSTMTSKYSN
jgi:hypothetical protein